MGCDIHIVLERRHKSGKWIGIDTFRSMTLRPGETKYGYAFPPARERNYERFAKLAGVRGEGPDPRGVPADASSLTWALYEDWDGDGHSHSWASLEEAVAIFLETDDHKPEYPYDYFFGVDVHDETHIDEYRIVYFFDN